VNNKLWSIVFGVVMAACGLSFIVSPFVGWGLPEGVSKHSAKVDELYYIILIITGIFFFLTEAILIAFMWLYAAEPGAPRPVRATGWRGALKPLQGVLHDAHRIEMAWTLIPALILLYIAFVQINTWAEVKYLKEMPEFGKTDVAPLQVDVSARQFEWRVRYPSSARLRKWIDPNNRANQDVRADFYSFAKRPQADDVHLVNELHCWKDEATVVYLSTRDVIHSFNIPVMRVKQDALPGKVIPVWFVPTRANTALDKNWLDEKAGTYVKKEYVDQINFSARGPVTDPSYRWDIPCAELCGWGHYRMIGRVYVHETDRDFLGWLEQAESEAHASSGPR
jgi:cytochrome c oxidase subunit II